MEVGTFITIISIIDGISDRIEGLFSAFLTWDAAKVPLRRVSKILNAETVSHLMQHINDTNKDILGNIME